LLQRVFKYGKYLCENKANLNQQNYNAATALIFASTFGREDIVRYLLLNGAQKNIKDRFGNTALDYAVNQENDQIVEILKRE
jgi:ankyrin repeat protein